MRYGVLALAIAAFGPTLLTLSHHASAQSLRPIQPVCSGPEIEPKLVEAIRAKIQPDLIRDAKLEASNFVPHGREGYRWLCQATATISGRRDHHGRPVNPCRIPEILYWVTRSEDGMLTVAFDASQLLAWVYINHGLYEQAPPPPAPPVPRRATAEEKTILMGLIRDQLHRCWNPPSRAGNSDRVRVRVSLSVDGTLAGEPRIVSNSGALGPELTRSVLDALRRCARVQMPQSAKPLHSDWKEVILEFSGD